MPLYHCSKCHHEQEDIKRKQSICDWCGAIGFVIAEMTDFEKFIKMWREGKFKL